MKDTSDRDADTCDNRCESCAVRGTCTDPAAGGRDGGQDLIATRMARIKHKIIVGSGKGGVGKSTVAVRLALSLRARGYAVGLLDADITGPNVPSLLGIEGQGLSQGPGGIVPVDAGGIKVVSMALVLSSADTAVVWRGPMKMAAIRQFLSDVDWGDLDFLLVDLPPGTSDEPLSLIQMVPDLTGAVIVTTPQEVAILDSRKAVNMILGMDVPVLGVVENMSGLVCPDCGEVVDVFGRGGGERAAEELGVPFLGRVLIDCDIGASKGGIATKSGLFDAVLTAFLERIAPEGGYLAGD